MNTWHDFFPVRALHVHDLSCQRTKEERMRKRYAMSLLTLGASAVFLLGMARAAEAELICKKFKPSGPKVCYEVSTGSVEFITLAKGVAAKLAKDCDGDPSNTDCHIVVIASVYGTIPQWEDEPDYEYCGVNEDFEFDGFPEGENACLISGEGQCGNPGINVFYNPTGTAFNLPGPLTAFSTTFTCESGGTCYEEVTVSAQDVSGICPNDNWTLLDFTPREFFGELAFCPGGFLDDLVQYSSGQWGPTCCASDKRSEIGGEITCFKPYQDGEPTEGEPGFIRTFCQYPNQGPIEKGVKYDCNEI
jgi:hypothetical protein